MLDIKFIRENPDIVKKAAQDKSCDVDINHLLGIDNKYRKLQHLVQKLREQKNKNNEEIIKRALELSKEEKKISPEVVKSALELSKIKPQLTPKLIKQVLDNGQQIRSKDDELEKQEHALKTVEEELRQWLFKIPNLPKQDIKVGKDEKENEVLRKFSEPKKLNFTPKDHLELGENLDIIDVKRAAKVSGARFAYLKNDAVLLEFVLVQLALETLTKEGFIPVIPPVLFRRSIAIGLGYFQGKDNDEYYWVSEPNLKSFNLGDHPGFYLAGTAEHTIVPMHADETFAKRDLPRRYVGFSSAFRREAGSYGKDTRGILRVHQFDKVEMVSFVAEEDDDKEHEYLLSLEEKLLQLLDIPYRVVKMCTGDLGFPTARKYDIEAWIPSEQRYREVTSASTTTDFQARRLNIKYQDGNEKKFVHILNATAFAIGRTMIAILENYQQKDGSVIVPKVLQKYFNKEIIAP